MTDLTIKELRSEWVEFASTFSGRGEARKYEEMFDRCLAQRDAEVQAQALREAADDLDLPGSTATGYYASEAVSGYNAAERDIEAWLVKRAARLTETTGAVERAAEALIEIREDLRVAREALERVRKVASLYASGRGGPVARRILTAIDGRDETEEG